MVEGHRVGVGSRWCETEEAGRPGPHRTRNVLRNRQGALSWVEESGTNLPMEAF